MVAEEEPAAFKEMEATALTWLIARPDFAEAVDLALAGFEDQASSQIIQALKVVQEELDEEEAAEAARATEAAEGGKAAGAEAGKEPTAGATPQAEGGQPSAKRQRLHRGPTGPARCVCAVVAGLRGGGKSTLSNILREVLGGVWLNLDDFAAKHPDRSDKNVRQVFAAELRNCITKSLAYSDKDRNMRVVMVDRDTTLRAHRAETLYELKRLQWRRRGGKVLLVELTHSADSFGYGSDGQLSKRCGEQHVALCARRIEDRGAAHHTFWPTPKLRAALQKAARETEAVSPEELSHFDGRISVDVTLPPPEAALVVIEELRNLGWLEQIRSREELQPKVEVAWQAYRRAESQWREGAAAAAGPEPHKEWLTQCRKVGEAKRKAEELVRAREEQAQQQGQQQRKSEQQQQQQKQQQWQTQQQTRQQVQQHAQQEAQQPTQQPMQQPAEEGLPRQAEQEAVAPPPPPPPRPPPQWQLDVPGFLRVLTRPGLLPKGLERAERPCVQLLPLEGTGLEPEELRVRKEALEALQGDEFDVYLKEIVIVDGMACIGIINLPSLLPCCNRAPHVIMGKKSGVSPRCVNSLLDEVMAGSRSAFRQPVEHPTAMKGKLVLES